MPAPEEKPQKKLLDEEGKEIVVMPALEELRRRRDNLRRFVGMLKALPRN